MSVKTYENEINTFKKDAYFELRKMQLDNTNIFLCLDDIASQNRFCTHLIKIEEYIHKYVDRMSHDQINAILFDYKIGVKHHQKKLVIDIFKKKMGMVI